MAGLRKSLSRDTAHTHVETLAQDSPFSMNFDSSSDVLYLWPQMGVSLPFTASPRQRVGSRGWAGVPDEAAGKTSEARAEAFSWVKCQFPGARSPSSESFERSFEQVSFPSISRIGAE